MERIALVIPTLNAGLEFTEVLTLINDQSSVLDKKIIFDSESEDETVKIAVKNGFKVEKIKRANFGHGKSRTYIAKVLKDYDYIIYMTQDVFFQRNALKELVDFIKSDSDLGVVYGKQEVDFEKSNIFEKKAREFNYPETSMIKRYQDRDRLGIKTVFSSDAFAIYRSRILEEVGYFPEVNFAEDMAVAAKMIKKGYAVGYCAEAKCYHSHNYSVLEEYKRMKIIGEFHRENPWIQKEFGSNESEGIKSVIEEFKYLLRNGKFYLIPESILRFGMKYLGYRSGCRK